ncbi:hypothetical protein IVB40_16745 [Bradyrhizobium sp. 40]|jgi:hypothetical protein|uniref:hypothetical protein n=1 Tax=Bradyrhizobium sp. 40 TaxID=2782674 RepID=UPI001FFFB807|nr:hypothetical protein [Bradyrhizobium sp. 40]UPJ45543.1 hypothetical protein IVB40_16745 [Bradyrhizobium sp. 40]
MASKKMDEGDGPLAKDFVAVRVNLTSAQLDQVLTALGVAKKHRANFTPGQAFIVQKRKPASKKKSQRRPAKK